MQERQSDSLMTDNFSNSKGRGDNGEKYKNNCLASVRASKKTWKDEEADTQKNKMIKKSTRKVIFEEKKGIRSLLLVQYPGITLERGIQNPRVSFITLHGACGGSREGAQGTRSLLIFGPNWGPQRWKKIFFGQLPLLSGSGWLLSPFSEGLNPPLGAINFQVTTLILFT